MSAVGVVLIVMAALAAAALLGAVAGLGNRLLLVPFIGGGALLAVLIVPVRWQVWALVAMSFLVVGPAIYFARLEAARWLAPGLGILLTLPLLLGLLSGRERMPGKLALPASLKLYILFLVVLAFSTAVSSPRLGELVPAFRMYLAYLPLGLIIALGFLGAADLERLWRFLLVCAVIQFPVVVYQQLVFVAARQSVAAADAITGTFPGNPEGGGANAAMSIFTVIATLIAISLWRAGFLRLRWVLAVSLSSLGTVLIGEVKAVALLIPVALALLFARDLAKRPGLALAGIGAGLVLAVAIFAVYQKTHFTDRAPSVFSRSSAPATPLESVQNQLNPELHVRGLNAGRAFTLYDWAVRIPGSGKVAETVMGYGAGATQFGRLGVGEVFELLLYRVSITGSGLLLWEAGVLGHLLIVACFATAAFAGFRLCRRPDVPAVHRAVLHAVAVGMLLYLISLPYTHFHFSTPPSQVLLFVSLGYISYWQRMLGWSPALTPGVPPRFNSSR